MKKGLLLFWVPLALAGCSHSEYEGPDRAGGKLQVRANVKEAGTRVTGSQWEAGDRIGLSSSAGQDNILYVTEAGNGNFESESSVYVLGGGVTTYTAYYPYTDAVSSVSPEISFDTASDYMWATTTATRDEPYAEFEFAHCMSKLSITLTDNTISTTPAGSTIKIDGVAVSGKFNTLTGEVAADAAKKAVTKDFTLSKPVEVILPAQAVSQISLLVLYNGKAYGGVLTLTELMSGMEYHYTINLGTSDPSAPLNVSDVTITDWTHTDGGNVDIDEVEIPDEENVLEVGDFLMKDGTVLDKNSAKLMSKLDQVAGVVYYVGNAQPSVLYPSSYADTQDILLKEFPSCVNGLAIALRNYSENASRYSSGKRNYSSWLREAGNEDLLAQYIPDTFTKTSASTLMLGYNNTRVIQKAYELGITSDQATVTVIENFNTENAVANASYWYIPSNGEMELVKENYDVVKASVEKAGGTLEQYPGFNAMTEDDEGNRTYARNENFYWTADQRNDINNWGNSLSPEAASINVTRNSNSNKGYFRFSIVF